MTKTLCYRNKRIAANMEKMPEWIEKYLHQNGAGKKKSKKNVEEKDQIPSFNFLQEPSHPQVIKYMKELDKSKSKT